MDDERSTKPARKNRIDGAIRLYRGQRVILDMDIAHLYGVPVAQLNQAVKRNRTRFPPDFMFQVTKEEMPVSQSTDDDPNLKSQIVISSPRWGGRRSLPYAFTEEGVAMLSSVLRSPRAIHVNIEIMRAFVRLRGMLGGGGADGARPPSIARPADSKRPAPCYWPLPAGSHPMTLTR